MSWLRALLCLLLLQPSVSVAQTRCIIAHYQRYLELHSEAFLEAAQQLEQENEALYERVSDFIDYQIFTNTLKGYSADYLARQAPHLLNHQLPLAQLITVPATGEIRRVVLSDPTYRHNMSSWTAQNRRFLDRQNYTEAEWDAWVAVRNQLNQILAKTPQYPEVLRYFQTPGQSLCRTRVN